MGGKFNYFSPLGFDVERDSDYGTLKLSFTSSEL